MNARKEQFYTYFVHLSKVLFNKAVLLFKGSVCILICILLLNNRLQAHYELNFLDKNIAQCKDNCDFNTTNTEMLQLLTYLNNVSYYNKIKPSTAFSFNVEILQINYNKVCIEIRDKRFDSPFLRLGGASFQIKAIGKIHLYYCAYVDNFNGVYHVACNLYENNTSISIILLFLDFGAYRFDGILIKTVIWENNVMRNNKIFSSHVIPHQSVYTGWHKDNEQHGWTWVKYGKNQLSENELRSCVERLPSIEAIGDSHLRYALFYMLYLSGNLTLNIIQSKERSDVSYGKIHFVFSSVIVNSKTAQKTFVGPWSAVASANVREFGLSDAINAIESWKNKYVQSQFYIDAIRRKNYMYRNKDAFNAHNETSVVLPFIISAGSWDIANRHVQHFVWNSIQILKSLVQTLGEIAKQLGTKVIVINLPSYNEMSSVLWQNNVRYDLRNGAVLAAVNALLSEAFHSYDNVILLDWFEISRSRNDETIGDSIHYIRPYLFHDGIHMIGDVGIAMANSLISELCTSLY